MEGRLDALMLTVKKRSEPLQLNLLLLFIRAERNCIQPEFAILHRFLVLYFSVLTKICSFSTHYYHIWIQFSQI